MGTTGKSKPKTNPRMVDSINEINNPLLTPQHTSKLLGKFKVISSRNVKFLEFYSKIAPKVEDVTNSCH